MFKKNRLIFISVCLYRNSALRDKLSTFWSISGLNIGCSEPVNHSFFFFKKEKRKKNRVSDTYRASASGVI